jgi:hypothetical protein
MSKFSKISFPIFGLKEVIKFEFTLDKIFTTINKQKFIVDDKNIKNQNYLSRLIELDSRKDYQRLKFDYTIRNMEELIKINCKIGIDTLGNIHTFDIKEQFKYSEREISKVKIPYFWFKNISYPFKIDVENISEIADNSSFYYGKLAYINKTWYFLGLTDEKTDKDTVWI